MSSALRRQPSFELIDDSPQVEEPTTEDILGAGFRAAFEKASFKDLANHENPLHSSFLRFLGTVVNLPYLAVNAAETGHDNDLLMRVQDKRVVVVVWKVISILWNYDVRFSNGNQQISRRCSGFCDVPPSVFVKVKELLVG